MKTELDILTETLTHAIGKQAVDNSVEKIKAVLKENNLDMCPSTLHDLLRVVELILDPRKDKYYGKY